MAELKNPKHELFAAKVAAGVSLTEAAKAAGFSELRAAAQGSLMARRPAISARIRELRGEITQESVRSCGLDRSWVMQQLQELAIEARASGKYQSAVSAVTTIGKELGMFVEKTEVSGPDGGPVQTSLEVVFVKPA